MQRLALLCAFSTLAGCAGEKTFSPKPDGDVAMGQQRLLFVDGDRRSWDGRSARPIATVVWYRAADGAKIQEFVIPPENPVFVGGWASPDAAPAPGKRPLILLSHGTGGAAFQMMWLAARLVDAGYIVAAVNHHGNTAAEQGYDARGFRLPAERARDISVALDRLLADPTFGPLIDDRRVGAAGYSLGGHTVVALVGGRTSFAQFETFCASASADATCKPQAEFPTAEKDFAAMLADDGALRARLAAQEGDFADPRVRSVVAIAPALMQAVTSDSLARVKAPIAVIAGSADHVAPLATNAERLASKVVDAKLTVIDGAGHYSFMSECTPRGKRFAPVCDDKGADRRAIHDAAAAAAIDHFGRTMPAGALR